MVYLLHYLIYVVYIVLGYLLSIFIKYILDYKWHYFRFDNWLLFVLLVKSPMASSKVVLVSSSRPKIDEIRGKITKNYDLDKNEKPQDNSYIFTVKRHQTAMNIKIIEPDKSGKFTLTLETLSKDPLPKILYNSQFERTIQIFEEIVRLLGDYKLSVISVEIDITPRISDKNNISATYYYDKNVISYNKMTLNSKSFTDITVLAKDCIKFWRNHFL